ncbi:MAG: hypothetical protein LBP59_11360, partial [Planctomycetaceae bacterium]|nr:hypothetical protein [Planctomycetaceae bacterium]
MKTKMKNKHVIFFAFVVIVVILARCILYADDQEDDTGGFTYTLEIYPKKITLHELIYVRLTLENKTNRTLQARSGKRDFTCFVAIVCDNKTDTYSYPYDIGLNIVLGQLDKILPNERFMPVNFFLEFPEKLTLTNFRKELDPTKNANFIKKYVDSGKKCKMIIYLRDTGKYISDEFEINSRPDKEMKTIEKWYSQFSNFLAETHRVSKTIDENSMTSKKWKRIPTIKDYQNFESELSDGTLKNFIKFRRLLTAIPEDNNLTLPKFEITKPFSDLGDYLDTLPQMERDCLVVEAMKYFNYLDKIYSKKNANYFKMKYLLIPKLPKSERAKYIDDIENKEYKKILLNSPEPDNKTASNLPSPASSGSSVT